MLLSSIYAGKRVLITGHTGFKGTWLSEWLLQLGANVWGYSLPPPTEPSLFIQIGLENRINHHVGDVRNSNNLTSFIKKIKPDFIFHLAAQPLVRLSYEQPFETYETNVIGTINVLEALRHLTSPCVAVFITTDKCYENKEWHYGYREIDPLGGHDPYSSSKAAAEIAIASWRKSFFTHTSSQVFIASARAGNVIGGGDWAKDRILPDLIRSLLKSEPIYVRNPRSTRPWQHVLEPLNGYLVLGANLKRLMEEKPNDSSSKTLESAFNFGPGLASNRSVKDLVEESLKHWPGSWIDKSTTNSVHEASLLNLATDKAYHILKWKPRWSFEQTVKQTLDWYKEFRDQNDTEKLRRFTINQIHQYEASI